MTGLAVTGTDPTRRRPAPQPRPPGPGAVGYPSTPLPHPLGQPGPTTVNTALLPRRRSPMLRPPLLRAPHSPLPAPRCHNRAEVAS
jgi:hypothetical protein